jgi:amino acid transporter
MALAFDGYLPRAFTRVDPLLGTPPVAVLVCAAAYAACLGLGFDRLVELDVLLYGLSLGLEFVSLVALRLREPSLPRRFRVPGGVAGCILLGLLPMSLLIIALVTQGGSPGHFLLGAGLVVAGPVVYWIRKALH